MLEQELFQLVSELPISGHHADLSIRCAIHPGVKFTPPVYALWWTDSRGARHSVRLMWSVEDLIRAVREVEEGVEK